MQAVGPCMEGREGCCKTSKATRMCASWALWERLILGRAPLGFDLTGQTRGAWVSVQPCVVWDT